MGTFTAHVNTSIASGPSEETKETLKPSGNTGAAAHRPVAAAAATRGAGLWSQVVTAVRHGGGARPPNAALQ